MVDRYIFIKLLDEHVPVRVPFADHLAAELGGIAAEACPEASVEVGVPADDSAARWDVSVVVHAPDLEAWAAVARAATVLLDEWLPAQAAVVKAWTFELRG